MSKKEIGIYIIKKILLFLASIFLLSVIVFYISRLAPGDPLVSYYGERVEKMSPEEHDWAMEKLGLNESVSVQYVKWLSNAFHGEFGISYKYKMDVLEVISGRVGNTMLLGGIGFVLIFTLALLLGILCAWHEEKWLDNIICQVGTVTSCIPEFWFSLVLILFFAVELHILPSSGAYTKIRYRAVPSNYADGGADNGNGKAVLSRCLFEGNYGKGAGVPQGETWL